MDTQQIQHLVDKRDALRRAGYWHEADRIRHELYDAAVDVHDGPEGTTWRKSPTRRTPEEQDSRDAFWANIEKAGT